MDDKQKPQLPDGQNEPSAKPVDWSDTWVTDMKQDLEDYLEEQGIYIRQ